MALTGGCKKRYPDDKWPHLKSPTKRLAREWKFYDTEFLTSYSYPFPGDFRGHSLIFLSNGTCTSSVPIPSPEMIYLIDFNGTWEFIDNDSKIKITFKKNPSYSKVWTIARLDNRGLDIYCDSVKYSLDKR